VKRFASKAQHGLHGEKAVDGAGIAMAGDGDAGACQFLSV